MMKTTTRLASLFLILIAAACPPAARGAEDAVDAIEKELAATLKEMDALASELDRIEEVAVTPKATSVRIEIRKGGQVPAPAGARLFLSGKPEAEREWTKGERDGFLSGTEPVVLAAPLLPGTNEGRIVLTHPSWKTPPSHDFRTSVKAGETFLLRLTLSTPPGKSEPVLVSSPEK